MSAIGDEGSNAAGNPAVRLLRRQGLLLEFALASMQRHRGKTAVLGTVLTLIVFLLASLTFLRSSVRFEAAMMLRDAPDLVVQNWVAGGQDLVPQTAVAAVQAIPGVGRAQGRLWGYYYDGAARANYTLVVPLTAPPADGETAIGAGISRSRQGYSQDVLAFRSYGGAAVLLTVKAVLPERADFVAGDLMLVSEHDFRTLFALPPDVANDIVVYLKPGADPAAVQREVVRVLPGAHLVARQEILATAASFLDGWRGLPAIVLLAMALAIGIVAADKPAALGVEERREMGVLRALGWSATEVLAAKAWESLTVSVVAFIVGALAAYAHIFLGGAALFTPILRGWAVLFPVLDLVPAVNPGEVGLIAAGTILIPLAGSLLACYRPAAANPDAVIRDE